VNQNALNTFRKCTGPAVGSWGRGNSSTDIMVLVFVHAEDAECQKSFGAVDLIELMLTVKSPVVG